MVFPDESFLIEIPSLHQTFGKQSLKLQVLNFLLVLHITLRQMVKPNDSIKSLKTCFKHTVFKNQLNGFAISIWQNLLIMHHFKGLQVCLLSKHSMVRNVLHLLNGPTLCLKYKHLKKCQMRCNDRLISFVLKSRLPGIVKSLTLILTNQIGNFKKGTWSFYESNQSATLYHWENTRSLVLAIVDLMSSPRR